MTTAAAADNPCIFASYEHEVERHDDEFVRQLCEKLKTEIKIITGETQIDFFLDKESIEWGQAWRTRVDSGLDTSTFLLAVVTPLFLRSKECRREVLRFAELEKARNRDDLILPLYYVDSPEIEGLDDREPKNETERVAKIILDHQYRDWRSLRFRSWNEPERRQATNDLSKRLVKAIHRVRPAAVAPNRPSLPPGVITRLVDPNKPSTGSLLEAVAEAQPGDHIVLTQGRHDATGMRIVHPITIEGRGEPASVVLNTESEVGIEVDSTWVQMENLVVEHTGKGVAGIHLQVQRGGLVRCSISVKSGVGIEIAGPGVPRIHECRVRGGMYGIRVMQGARPHIESCDVSRATGAGIMCGLEGNPFVEKCVISGNAHGVWLYEGARGRFIGNTLVGNTRAAWDVAPGCATEREGNVE